MAKVSADVKILRRLKVAAAVLFALGAAVGLRLFQIQVLQHEELTVRSKQQYIETLRLEPKRGTIYDRNMKELAVSVPVSSLYANPAKISDVETTAAKLSPILGKSEEELISKLSSSEPFIWVHRKGTPAQAREVAALNLRGLSFVQENKRYYPKRALAAQILGFVGTDNQGLEGLEFMYNQFVGGSPSLMLVEKDAKGRKIYPSGRILKEGTKGLDIILNIDETIQYIAEKELAFQVNESKARGGVAIVMNPKSGEVLALAQQPSFNPNSFSDYRPTRWKSSIIGETYETGSTFKVVALAGVLEEGLARPDEMIYAENGTMVVAGKAFRDIHNYRWLTVREVISKSSNIGTIKLSQRLGSDLLHKYVKRFGFGSKTGIDLPGEATGIVREPKEWSRVSIGSVSIGYEVSITPVQLITAYAAVANGGLLVEPRVVRGVVRDGRLMDVGALPAAPSVGGASPAPTITRRAILPETAEVINSILKEVVENGTGQAAAVEGYTVAGKTGTARKFDSQLGAYSPDKYAASFVGYLPADEPRVIILVVIDEPQGAFFGGVVAAPAFKRIASQVVRYLRIPADGSLIEVAEVNSPEKEAPVEKSKRDLESLFSALPEAIKQFFNEAKSYFVGSLNGQMANKSKNGKLGGES